MTSLGSGLKTRTGICSQASPRPSRRPQGSPTLCLHPRGPPKWLLGDFVPPKFQDVPGTMIAQKSLGSPPRASTCMWALATFTAAPEVSGAQGLGLTPRQAAPGGLTPPPWEVPESQPGNGVGSGISCPNHAARRCPDLPHRCLGHREGPSRATPAPRGRGVGESLTAPHSASSALLPPPASSPSWALPRAAAGGPRGPQRRAPTQPFPRGHRDDSPRDRGAPAARRARPDGVQQQGVTWAWVQILPASPP